MLQTNTPEGGSDRGAHENICRFCDACGDCDGYADITGEIWMCFAAVPWFAVMVEVEVEARPGFWISVPKREKALGVAGCMRSVCSGEGGGIMGGGGMVGLLVRKFAGEEGVICASVLVHGPAVATACFSVIGAIADGVGGYLREGKG